MKTKNTFGPVSSVLLLDVHGDFYSFSDAHGGFTRVKCGFGAHPDGGFWAMTIGFAF